MIKRAGKAASKLYRKNERRTRFQAGSNVAVCVMHLAAQAPRADHVFGDAMRVVDTLYPLVHVLGVGAEEAQVIHALKGFAVRTSPTNSHMAAIVQRR